MKVLHNIFKNFLKNQENKKYFIIYLISIMLCYPIESIVIPFLTGKLVNILYEKKKDIKKILIALSLIIFGWIVNTITYYTANISDAYLTPNFILYFRNFIMQKLFIKYENNYDEIKIGIITSKLITLPDNFREMFDLSLTFMIPKIFIIIVISLYLMYLDYKLAIIIILSFTFLSISIYNISNKCLIITRETTAYFENINEEYKDKLSNISSIFSSNKIKDEINNTNDINSTYRNYLNKSLNCINDIKLISYVNNIFLFIAINIVNIYLFKNNVINGGEFVSIFLTLLYYLQYLMDISYSAPKIIEFYGILKNSESFLENLETTNNDNRPDITIKNYNIKLENIYFGYNNKLLFNNLNIEFEDNKKVAIIGKSGSGKSTVIKLIMGYYKINEGNIFIGGKNVNEYNIGSIRKNISYINQNTKLFNLSVYDNILYGNEGKDKKYVDNIIKSMNIQNIYKNLEHGMETNVGVDGDKLSGGQKQITFLIRELIGNKKIFILDEPTSALDGINKQIILDLIKKIKDKTVIIITHDIDLTKYVDITYLINDGVITKK
jgi:ABC-type multidrug transport system fused ATPase/permease subunit